MAKSFSNPHYPTPKMLRL